MQLFSIFEKMGGVKSYTNLLLHIIIDTKYHVLCIFFFWTHKGLFYLYIFLVCQFSHVYTISIFDKWNIYWMYQFYTCKILLLSDTNSTNHVYEFIASTMKVLVFLLFIQFFESMLFHSKKSGPHKSGTILWG